MPSIDYDAISSLLEEEFTEVESTLLEDKKPSTAQKLIPHFDQIFQSRTQAYREVLLGCVLARLQNKVINIRKPYMGQGEDAYNGRTLDEKVINPFFQSKRIPCSRGPFLSTFRRSVMFDERTRTGLRDKEGYDSFLALVNYLVREVEGQRLTRFLHYLLYRFLELRRESDIPLSHIQRISLEQYDDLITGLLSTPSGGRFPVLLIKVTLEAINRLFGLGWTIEAQGINVADRPSGAGGDVTVKKDEEILMAAEITERPIGKNQVIATFQTKIAPHSIEDYLFFVTSKVDEGAKQQARRYFSQGHEVNFLEIKNWILVTLATVGKKGRKLFNEILLEEFNAVDIPSSLKIAWNDQIARITTA